MKKLIVGLTLVTFAFVSLAQADDARAKTADKTSAKASAKTGATEKSACCATETTSKSGCGDKSACCSGEKFTRKAANPDQKGAMFLVKR